MYVQADAKQLEWRTVLALSGDTTGKRELNDGQDPHELNRVAFTLPSRLVSKRYLFRTIFRGTGWAFSIDPDFIDTSDDPGFWDDVNRKFYRKYCGIEKWHQELFRKVATRTPIFSPTGSYWYGDIRDNGKVNQQSTSNYPVQGTGADIMATARIAVRNRLKKLDKPLWFMVLSVHDSIVLDVPPEDVLEAAAMLYSVFDNISKNLIKLFNWDTGLEFPAEIQVGSDLSNMSMYPMREQDNLLSNKDVDCYVNPIDTTGAMGKGLALAFSKKHNTLKKEYYKAPCTEEGEVFPFWYTEIDSKGEEVTKCVLNVVTKKHWKDKSSIEGVKKGLQNIRKFCNKRSMSVGLPAIGCGLGGLDWKDVSKLVLEEFKDLETDSYIYQPNGI